MSSGNMICPKCKTFQPAAETCAECGVVVAKLRNPPNARTTPKEKKGSRQPSLPSGENLFLNPWFLRSVVAIVGVLAMWIFVGSDLGLNKHQEGVQGIRQAAEQNRRLAEEAEKETRYSIEPPTAEELGFDLSRFAAELNAVASTTTVSLEARDLKRDFGACAEFTDGYFTPLHYLAKEDYPVPQRETLPYGKDAPKGAYRYRCEGSDGITHLKEAPKSEDEFSSCWWREDPQLLRSRSSDLKKRTRLWVRMKWDTEANHWAVYSRAEQRHVDRKRMERARSSVNRDIDRLHRSRARRARKKIPQLIATIEDAREKMSVIEDGNLRVRFEITLNRSTNALKRALIDERYTHICKTAAVAALDARERKL